MVHERRGGQACTPQTQQAGVRAHGCEERGHRHPSHSCSRCKGRTTRQSSCCCCCHRGCRSCRQNGHQQVGKCCRSPLLVHVAPAHAARVQHRTKTKPRHRHTSVHTHQTQSPKTYDTTAAIRGAGARAPAGAADTQPNLCNNRGVDPN